ncbi:MAG TPA: HAMP domain-containing sensor histidine kinase [Oceanobacillus sp.]|nr:HAMP domain-containing sensor histidine kinase [Oceanobacillus sp.]
MTAMEQAQALLDELLQAARNGTIIPVRLPGQLEAIQEQLAKAKEERKAEESKPPVDTETFLKEQAYFIGHAIHELRTPMTSIRGYADMLSNAAMGPLNDMQKQFVDTVRTNSKRMEGLLSDVSDMNKLRAGTLRANEKMDMFKNIAMMVEKQTQPLAEQLNRKLVFDIPQGLPILNTDGELLAKAITKLVENALRYQQQENGEVTVRASSEGNQLIIKVEDNGIGMTPEEVAQLGTIYFRSDDELVRSYKGSGLGIPVAYGIIRLLNGTINVQSEKGKGTTFTITLAGMT